MDGPRGNNYSAVDSPGGPLLGGTTYSMIDPASWYIAFWGALISKDATMASAYTTVQEHIGHLTRHDPIGCDRSEAVLYVHSVFGSSSILHSLWYHCREGY